jgi:hypothetical protein
MNAAAVARLSLVLKITVVSEDVAKALVYMVARIVQSKFFIHDWYYDKYDNMPESHHLISQALYVLEIVSGMLNREHPNKLLLNLLNAHEEGHNFFGSRFFRLLQLSKEMTEKVKEHKRQNTFVVYRASFQEEYKELDPKGADRHDWDLMIRMLSDFFGRRIPTNPFDRQGEDSHNPCKVFWLVEMIMLLTISGSDVLKMAEAKSWQELRELMEEYVEEYEDGFFEEFSKIIANSGDAVVEHDSECDFESDFEGDEDEDDFEGDNSDDDDDFDARREEFSERFHKWSQPGSSSPLTSCASTPFFQRLKLRRMSFKLKFRKFRPELSCLLIYQLCDDLSRNRSEVFHLLLECMILSHDIEEPQKMILALKEGEDEHFDIINKTMLQFCHMSGSNPKLPSQFQSSFRWQFLWLPRMFEFLSTHSAFASLSQATSEADLLLRLKRFQAEYGESQIWQILSRFLDDFRYE